MMKVLYYDCFAGISGDMNLGALIDLGVDPDFLKRELARLPVHGYELLIRRESRKGISGTRVEVRLSGKTDGKPEEMTDRGHGQNTGRGSRKNVSGTGQSSHNTYREIREMISSSRLSDRVKGLSQAIFRVIAEAEGKIHGMAIDDVHFHEVGAVDSIVDIVGAAICIHSLGPDAIYCGSVELGGGIVHCAHGTYPVPAPATAEILKDIPVKKGNVPYEATTPTGAALLSVLVNRFTERVEGKVTGTGYGIGATDGELPNVLRVFLMETTGAGIEEDGPSFVVECNIDDMNPEYYDYIMERLFSAGARDVYITPIIMKKSRPAAKLSVLCAAESEKKVKDILLKETSTLGVRKYAVEKTALERRMENVSTRYGTVRVKSAFYQGKWIKAKPEYEDCMRIARENNIPIHEVYREVEQLTGKKDDES